MDHRNIFPLDCADVIDPDCWRIDSKDFEGSEENERVFDIDMMDYGRFLSFNCALLTYAASEYLAKIIVIVIAYAWPCPTVLLQMQK